MPYANAPIALGCTNNIELFKVGKNSFVEYQLLRGEVLWPSTDQVIPGRDPVIYTMDGAGKVETGSVISGYLCSKKESSES